MSTYILKDDQQTGPYEDADIQSGLATGTFAYHDLAWREGLPDWQPLSTLYPPAAVALKPPPVPEVTRRASPTCQTCGQGTLMRRKKYRMSGPVVVIRYILLIPSVVGMLIGVLGLFLTGSAGTLTSGRIEQEARKQLEAKAIPEQIITKVISSKPVSDADTASLTPEQKSAIEATRLLVSSAKVGAGAGAVLAGGFFIVLIVMFFVGGLIGWLLVMRKKVLQCTDCGAVVAAS